MIVQEEMLLLSIVLKKDIPMSRRSIGIPCALLALVGFLFFSVARADEQVVTQKEVIREASSQSPELIQFVQEIVDWIGANTKYSTKGMELPSIALVSREILCAKGPFNGNKERCARFGVAGVYREDDQTLYFPENVDFKDPIERSRLAHELFHFIQGKNGVYDQLRDKKTCVGRIEAEAYMVEEKYRAYVHASPPFVPVHGALKFMWNCH